MKTLIYGGHVVDPANRVDAKLNLLIDNGKIAWGETTNIVTKENLEKVYGADICLRPWPEMGRSVCVFPSL